MHLGVDPITQPHFEPAAGRVDPGPDVSPLIARSHRLERALTNLAPGPLRRRLEPDAMLIHRPDLHGRFGVVALDLLGILSQIFLSTAPAQQPQQIRCAVVGWMCRSNPRL